jgi:hypothetical protein
MTPFEKMDKARRALEAAERELEPLRIELRQAEVEWARDMNKFYASIGSQVRRY